MNDIAASTESGDSVLVYLLRCYQGPEKINAVEAQCKSDAGLSDYIQQWNPLLNKSIWYAITGIILKFVSWHPNNLLYRLSDR